MLSFTACATHCRGRIGSAGTWPGRFSAYVPERRPDDCGVAPAVAAPRPPPRPRTVLSEARRAAPVLREQRLELGRMRETFPGPAVRHFSAATALAIRSRTSTSSGPCCRSAAMNPPRNASPAPVVSTHGHAEGGRPDSRGLRSAPGSRCGPSVTHVSAGCSSAWSRSSARPVSDDAVQRSGNPSDAITTSMSGRRRSSPGRTASTSIAVMTPASRATVAAATDASTSSQSTSSIREVRTAGAGTSAGGEREARVAIPEHRAITRASIHDDHREPRLGASHDFGGAQRPRLRW